VVNISIQNARQVISSVTTDNAIGGQNTTTYKYGNAKVNVKGRGNLGFGIAVVINIGLIGDNGDEW
jgi:hypothetical protein